jgi:hypothetical protein
VFGDAEGKPVGLKFWRYAKLLEDTASRPMAAR